MGRTNFRNLWSATLKITTISSATGSPESLKPATFSTAFICLALLNVSPGEASPGSGSSPSSSSSSSSSSHHAFNAATNFSNTANSRTDAGSTARCLDLFAPPSITNNNNSNAINKINTSISNGTSAGNGNAIDAGADAATESFSLPKTPLTAQLKTEVVATWQRLKSHVQSLSVSISTALKSRTSTSGARGPEEGPSTDIGDQRQHKLEKKAQTYNEDADQPKSDPAKTQVLQRLVNSPFKTYYAKQIFTEVSGNFLTATQPKTSAYHHFKQPAVFEPLDAVKAEALRQNADILKMKIYSGADTAKNRPLYFPVGYRIAGIAIENSKLENNGNHVNGTNGGAPNLNPSRNDLIKEVIPNQIELTVKQNEFLILYSYKSPKNPVHWTVFLEKTPARLLSESEHKELTHVSDPIQLEQLPREWVQFITNLQVETKTHNLPNLVVTQRLIEFIKTHLLYQVDANTITDVSQMIWAGSCQCSGGNQILITFLRQFFSIPAIGANGVMGSRETDNNQDDLILSTSTGHRFSLVYDDRRHIFVAVDGTPNQETRPKKHENNDPRYSDPIEDKDSQPSDPSTTLDESTEDLLSELLESNDHNSNPNSESNLEPDSDSRSGSGSKLPSNKNPATQAHPNALSLSTAMVLSRLFEQLHLHNLIAPDPGSMNSSKASTTGSSTARESDANRFDPSKWKKAIASTQRKLIQVSDTSQALAATELKALSRLTSIMSTSAVEVLQRIANNQIELTDARTAALQLKFVYLLSRLGNHLPQSPLKTQLKSIEATLKELWHSLEEAGTSSSKSKAALPSSADTFVNKEIQKWLPGAFSKHLAERSGMTQTLRILAELNQHVRLAQMKKATQFGRLELRMSPHRSDEADFESQLLTEIDDPEQVERGSVSARYDLQRLESGELFHRLYPEEAINLRRKGNAKNKPGLEATYILLDGSGSMKFDRRGQVRDLLTMAWLDELLSEEWNLDGRSPEEGSKAVFIGQYTYDAPVFIEIRSREEAAKLFEQMHEKFEQVLNSKEFDKSATENKFESFFKSEGGSNLSSAISTAFRHAQAQGSKGISRLNLRLVTDGEESFTVDGLKQNREILPPHAEVNITGVNLVTPNPQLETFIRQSTLRRLSQQGSYVFLDANRVASISEMQNSTIMSRFSSDLPQHFERLTTLSQSARKKIARLIEKW
jgi:hypothetical protein